MIRSNTHWLNILIWFISDRSQVLVGLIINFSALQGGGDREGVTFIVSYDPPPPLFKTSTVRIFLEDKSPDQLACPYYSYLQSFFPLYYFYYHYSSYLGILQPNLPFNIDPNRYFCHWHSVRWGISKGKEGGYNFCYFFNCHLQTEEVNNYEIIVDVIVAIIFVDNREEE